jgi:competence ComEA-like helix-hairpin-helix protein
VSTTVTTQIRCTEIFLLDYITQVILGDCFLLSYYYFRKALCKFPAHFSLPLTPLCYHGREPEKILKKFFPERAFQHQNGYPSMILSSFCAVKKRVQHLQQRCLKFSFLEKITLCTLLASLAGNIFYLLSPVPLYQTRLFPIADAMKSTSGQKLSLEEPKITALSSVKVPIEAQISPVEISPEKADAPFVKASSHGRQPQKKQLSFKKKLPSLASISINHASVADFQKLPGIGVKIANRIVAYRKQTGGFQTLEALMDVDGIGKKKLAKMKPFLKL